MTQQTEPADISLDSLVGEHILDGVDMATESVKREWGDDFEDCAVIRFRLDGMIYCAVEDPNDGYRSSMKHLRVSTGEMKNTFAPLRVLAVKKTDGPYSSANNTLCLLDMVTGKSVVEVGTDNTDDYYPRFVGTFSPENMAPNAALAKAVS